MGHGELGSGGALAQKAYTWVLVHAYTVPSDAIAGAPSNAWGTPALSATYSQRSVPAVSWAKKAPIPAE
jgi:hypothetical protein